MLPGLKFFVLAFSALLPLINPLGSALIFLGIVGNAPPEVFQQLAKKIAVNMIVFLFIIELAGAALLAFFGISLPIVQFAGGFVLAAMGWDTLNAPDKTASENTKTSAAANTSGPVEQMIFYPLTFPITAGPGCLVVTLTLSAHASGHSIFNTVAGHLGIAVAIVALGVSVWLCYAYAPKITQKISPPTVQGILRVIAFVLLCIGVQISWNGLTALIRAMPHPA